MRLFVLASGSKGNATLVESNGHVIQIDMGISLRKYKERILETPFCIEDVEALLLTHDHVDHDAHARRFENSKIYTSCGTYKSMAEENTLHPYHRHLVANFEIIPLPTSHDATAPIGFVIESEGKKLVYMTDTGYISEKNLKYMNNPDYIIIESNHDVELLWKTGRPARLIMRIISDYGHLSNKDSANFISDIIGDKTKQILLAHLSEDANTPEIALESYKEILRQKGIDLSAVEVKTTSQHRVVKGGDEVWISK